MLWFSELSNTLSQVGYIYSQDPQETIGLPDLSKIMEIS